MTILRPTLSLALLFAVAPPAAAEPSPDWWSRVRQGIADSEYEISRQPDGWQAPNRSQNLRATFTEAGIRVVPRTEADPSWTWGLTWLGYGRGSTTWEVPAASLDPEGARIDYRRGPLGEWYENSPRGLKQGFTLSRPPEELHGERLERSGGPIHLDLALSGDLRPVISEDRQAIDFEAPGGARVLHYAQLEVTDAQQRKLKAWMEGFARSDARGIRIVIDDRDAVYPITVDPLATSPAWTAESDQAGAQFGQSVSTAGDVNGDGYSDVIVGAPNFDDGQTDEGRAFVFLGSASGLSGIAAWTAEADQATANFASSVATAGDVNGDGYSDVVVGAYNLDDGQTNEGRAYLYLGSAAGLSATAAWMAESDQSSARFGRSVATAGDVNGDGYSDVVVGANGFSNGMSPVGKVYVYLGSPTGLAGTAAWTVQGDQADGNFGISVATAGDVNRDGYADLVIGQFAYDNGQTDEGRALLYLGSAAGLATTPVWTVEGDQDNAQFGFTVGTAGDVNGDGYSDVIVGAPSFDWSGTDAGRAYLYTGYSGGLGSFYDWTAVGSHAGANLGFSVGTAGDVNGDGYADVVLGAYRLTNGESMEGGAYIYLGSGPGLLETPDWTFESDQANANLGIAVATAGDVDGDGRSDVIVGASMYANGQAAEGRVYVFQGSSSGLAATAGWSAEGDQDNARFGLAVATAGDVDGDGHADVLVGAPWYDGGQADQGRVVLFKGWDHGVWPDPGWIMDGDRACAAFGRSVSSAGDVNGDGYSDMIVGSPGGYCGGPWVEGRASVYLGSPSGPPYTDWSATCGQATAEFGVSVATAGDVNGDGYSDVIVGAQAYSNGFEREGRAYLYLGSSSGPGATAAWMTEGREESAYLGDSVAPAGDVDGDGYSDVLIGVFRAGTGEVVVHRGSPVGLSASPAWTIPAFQVDEGFGSTASTAGDVNGDGYSDVIVGAPYFSHDLQDEGRASVYLGSAAGLSGSPAWTVEGDQAYAEFGKSVSTGGDVNGDGYSDVVVGAPFYDKGQVDEGRVFVFLGSASGLSTSPSWTAESDQANAQFGYSVATAGDIEGNGYWDIVVGAPFYTNDQSSEGSAFVFYGGGGPGRYPPAQTQRRDDASAPIGPLGMSDDPSSFRIQLMNRTPFGRGLVRMQWEAKVLGTLFDGAGLQDDATWTDTWGNGRQQSAPVSGFQAGDRVHWRVRLLYSPVTFPFQPHSRWLPSSWNGPQETDLRTLLQADFTVTQSDGEDPVLLGETVTYALDVENLGPDEARGLVVDTIPPGSTFVSASGGGATCTHDAGVVRCELESFPPYAHRTVSVTVTPTAAGTATNTVRVGSYGRDPGTANDTSTEATEVLVPGIGNFVWMDYDADGAQDPVEPGQPGAIVVLYRQDGTLLGSTVTDAAGTYAFTNLTYGEFYYLRFFPPEPLVLSPRDQGVDDLADSDPDPATGRTITFGLLHGQDVSRWDAAVKWDGDGDGHTVWYNDCDDADPSVYPGAPQICDGKNNDCSDPSWPAVSPEEQDNDGDGYRYCAGDCSDLNPNWFPGQVEICDGIDDDCDGLVDEGCDGTCDLPVEPGDEIDLAPSAFNTSSPRLAWTGSSYGMVYSDLQDGNHDVYLARLDAQLNKIGVDVRVTNHTSNSLSPQIVWTGTYFGVTWQDDRDGNLEIYFTLLDAFGASLTGDVRVTNASGTSRVPRIAWSGLDFGVVWNDARDGTFEIWFVRLGLYGQPLAAEQRITTTPHESNNPRIVWNGSVYGFVYSDFRDDDYEIYFQAIDRAGSTVTPETRLTNASGVSRMPALAWDGAGAQFGVVWVDARSGADQLFFTRVAADGTKLTGDHPLAPIQNPSGAIVSIVHTGAEFGLAWWEQSDGNPEIYFGTLAGDSLRGAPIRLTNDPFTSQLPSIDWNGSDYVVGFSDDRAGASLFHPIVTRVGCCTVSTIGDRVWRDADVDGIQDPGESGVPGTLVAVYDGTGALLGASSSGADGAYRLPGLSCGGTYELRFFPPGSEYLAPQNQGTDDALDSDPDPATGSTGTFVLSSSADAAGWDAGIAACWPPDEPVYIASVGRTTDGNNYPILNFQDPNQPEQITGYQVYRSDAPGAAWPWPLVATDVVDMDAATPNLQWVDTSGDLSPTGAWYYQVTAYNHRCPAEGPR